MDDILYEAARIIDERGWCQGVGRRDDGSVCLYGAVMSAAYPETYGRGIMRIEEMWNGDPPAIQRLRAFLGSSSNVDIFLHNDTILSSREDAVKTLMEAAEYGGEE